MLYLLSHSKTNMIKHNNNSNYVIINFKLLIHIIFGVFVVFLTVLPGVIYGKLFTPSLDSRSPFKEKMFLGKYFQFEAR